MTALRMNIEMLRSQVEGNVALVEQAERTQRLAEELDQSVDFLAWQLRPAALDHLGLSAALGHLVTGWSERFGIPSEYDAFGLEGIRLASEVESNLHRLAQEALHNIVKHAQATHVSVVLERRNRQVVLVIEDDGVGFNATDRSGLRHGALGLVNMHERAVLVGGELFLDSMPGHGATVIVRLPEGQS